MTLTATTRRAFIAGGLSAAGAATGAVALAADRRFPFGLQLFSVDADMRRDLTATLRAVSDIGYREVELVGYYGRTPAELKRELAGAGLSCKSIHLRPLEPQNGGPSLADDVDMHLALCKELGVHYLVTPGPWLPERIARQLPRANLTLADVVAAAGRLEAEDWQRSANLINACAQRAHSFGLQLLYHNGNMEFATTGGETGFDRLLRLTDPELVKLELDCGWVTAAGHDPIRYLKAQRGRIRLLHIKDMHDTPANTAMRLDSAEMGTGTVDFKALLNAASAAGVERGYVEQEPPFTRPALESARINYRFLDSFVL